MADGNEQARGEPAAQIAPPASAEVPLPWWYRRRFLVGGAAIVIVAGIGLGLFFRSGGTPRLGIVPKAEIAALNVTLTPGQAPALVADAQACRVPLGQVQIWHDSGVPDSIVRIQSGGYVSPSFKITSTPELIALPYPAPYETGAGILTVLGTASSVNVSLNPGVFSADVNGAMPIQVVWRPGTPCQ